MHPLAFGLALAAAVLHVIWNFVVKASPDRLVAAFTVSGGAAVLALPVLAVTGLPDRRVIGLVLISGVVQTVYMIVLARAYEAGDMSFVYPLARGTSPLLITGAGVGLLGDSVSVPGAVGVAVVAGSLVLLSIARRRREGVWWAIATGGAIAVYTTIDAAASRLQGSATPVVAGVFVVHALLFGLYVARVRGVGAIGNRLRTEPMRSVVGGLGSGSGYLLVMTAAVMAPVGLVSAVRETSVVLGVLVGRRFLGESVSGLNLAAVLGAAGGAFLIALA